MKKLSMPLVIVFLIIPLAVIVPKVGLGQTPENSTRNIKASQKEEPKTISRSSAVSNIRLREKVSEGDQWCHYDNKSHACTRCPGTTAPCEQSSQPSLNACFASNLCDQSGSNKSRDINKLASRSNAPKKAVCFYNVTQGQCFAIELNPKGPSGVGSSVPDGAACEAHCNAN